MNYTNILKRAWHNVLNYRALWTFGIILALVTFSWGTAAFLGRDDESGGISIVRGPSETFGEALERTLQREFAQADRALEEFLARELTLEVESNLAAVIAVLLSTAVALYIIGRVARYVSETALIRMVNRQQEVGQQQTIRQGLRLGWSRSAWRLLFIELLVNLVAVAASLLLFALIFSPMPLWIKGSESTVIAGAILTAAIFLLAVLVIFLVIVFVSLLKIFSRRACAIEGLGVTASIYRGYALLSQNLKRILPLGLVMFAVNASWPALSGLILIMLFGVGILLGGLPALLVNWLVGLVAAGETAVFIAAAIGVIILILILAAPLAWLGGMRRVFLSSMWTLTYRELCQLEQSARDVPPEVQIAETPPWARGESGSGVTPPARQV
ncbi:MAG: hypothetical protein GQ526_04060 [Ardenticatenales bacterium]|nr:hypothetical protein [Ardenticatenales bacterium]